MLDKGSVIAFVRLFAVSFFSFFLLSNAIDRVCCLMVIAIGWVYVIDYEE